jgi:hypothetical protein
MASADITYQLGRDGKYVLVPRSPAAAGWMLKQLGLDPDMSIVSQSSVAFYVERDKLLSMLSSVPEGFVVEEKGNARPSGGRVSESARPVEPEIKLSPAGTVVADW